MKLRPKRLAAVAVATVIVLAGAPASATTTNDFAITCGTITVVVSALGASPLGACGSCSGGDYMRVDVTNTTGTATGPWTTGVTEFEARTVGVVASGTGWLPYLLVLTLVTTGTANNTGTIYANATVQQNLKLRGQFYNVTLPSCTQGTLLCTFTVSDLMNGGATAVPTTGTPPEEFVFGETVTLTSAGGTAVTTPPCTTAFTSMSFSTVSMSNVVFSSI